MRIVAGEWRGRALGAPSGTTTRPTSDRVRQALFDMLLHAPWAGPDSIQGARVLDAFAGTGALGLEALSRGAAHATFIEHDPDAVRALRRNVAVLGAEDRVRVISGDALHPPRARTPCSLVFLDPPYARPLTPPSPPVPEGEGDDVLHRALAALANAGWFAPGALIVAETARAAPSPHPHPLAERVHGAAKLTIWDANTW